MCIYIYIYGDIIFDEEKNERERADVLNVYIYRICGISRRIFRSTESACVYIHIQYVRAFALVLFLIKNYITVYIYIYTHIDIYIIYIFKFCL